MIIVFGNFPTLGIPSCSGLGMLSVRGSSGFCPRTIGRGLAGNCEGRTAARGIVAGTVGIEGTTCWGKKMAG
jgi:hypothetical protein